MKNYFSSFLESQKIIMFFDDEFIRKVCNKIMALQNQDPLFLYNKRRNFVSFLSSLASESFDLHNFQRILLNPENEAHLITAVYLLVERMDVLQNTQLFFSVDDDPTFTFSDVHTLRAYTFENHFFEQTKQKLLTNFFTPEDIDEIVIE